MAPGFVNGPLLRQPHPMLDLGERLLDGIKVGRVFWQEPQPCADSLDGVAALDEISETIEIRAEDGNVDPSWHRLDVGAEDQNPCRSGRQQQPDRAQADIET
jgi:hypothetical protein